ncbi:MAG: hypothetical protein KGK07_15190 [Chloroflexota bacterium]|nr:hypothetical protein [Chloroflexota bacterium]
MIEGEQRGLLAAVASRVTSLRVIVGAAVALLGVGAVGVATARSYATDADVASAVASHEAREDEVHSRHEAQLAAHEKRLTEQGEHMVEIHEDLRWIKSTLAAVAKHQRVPFAPPPREQP